MKRTEGKRVCCIFNTPAHYCRPIYSLIDKHFNCKFIFGDDAPTVKKFDTSLLRDCSFVQYRYINRILFVPGLIKYAFKSYDNYIINPSTNNFSMWLFLLILRLMPSKKVYTWTHGMYGNESKRQLFFKKMQNVLCDGEFVYGDYAISLMKNKGFKAEKLFPIHNSLDYDAQLELRSKTLQSDVYSRHFGNNNPVVLMIGRLNKRKRLSMLLDAAVLLKERGLVINIVLIGEGEDSANLEKLANENNVSSQLWLYGACYDEEEDAKLIYNADVCVMPGDIGLTAIHSMMFGLPVITHNLFSSHGPEFEVIKPGITGAFYDYNSIDSLANTILNWVKHTTERETVRESCYNIIDNEWNPYYQIKVLESVLSY